MGACKYTEICNLKHGVDGCTARSFSQAKSENCIVFKILEDIEEIKKVI